MSGFDLRALLAALVEGGVEFVVIGGVAVGAHGYIRATEDLDVVPDSDPQNLTRMVAALGSLEATLPTARDRPFDPETDGAKLVRGGNLTADTAFGGLDVVQSASGVPSYAVLSEDAVASELLGFPSVCSLARLREMKQAQGRPQDQADLENLPQV